MGFKFQVKLSGHWNNYSDEENAFLTRAYMSGLKGCKYLLRGNHYEYNFNTMEQVNLQSGKRRQIRAPPNLRPPAQPVVKPGPTVCVVVPPNAKGGDVLHVPHPQNKSVMMQVNVPMGAAPGATLLVPVPPLAIANHQKKKIVPQPQAIANGPAAADPAAAPAPAADASKSQAAAGPSHEKGLAIGAAAGVAGAAAVGAGVAVGMMAADGQLDGVIAGAGDMAADAGDAIGDVAADGAALVGDAAEAVADAAEPIIDELGEFAGDAADFIIDLF